MTPIEFENNLINFKSKGQLKHNLQSNLVTTLN